jgi:hypothetical protein
MIVTFCGHREVETPELVYHWLYGTVEELLKGGANIFYLGGYGAFERMAAAVVREFTAQYPQIEIVLVLPYLYSKIDTAGYTSTLYPSLESVPPRYAISRRNRWMAEQADIVVAYVLHGWGGAAKMLEYAQRRQKKTICFSTNTGGKL